MTNIEHTFRTENINRLYFLLRHAFELIYFHVKIVNLAGYLAVNPRK